MEHSSCYTV